MRDVPQRSPQIVVATVVAGAIVLLSLFASQFVLLELLIRRLGLPLLLALAAGFGVVACGRLVLLVLRRITRSEGHDLERDPAFAFVVGHPFFGLFAFLISLVAATPMTLGIFL